MFMYMYVCVYAMYCILSIDYSSYYVMLMHVRSVLNVIYACTYTVYGMLCAICAILSVHSSPVAILVEKCDHSVVVHDLCCDCGMDTRR